MRVASAWLNSSFLRNILDSFDRSLVGDVIVAKHTRSGWRMRDWRRPSFEIDRKRVAGVWWWMSSLSDLLNVHGGSLVEDVTSAGSTLCGWRMFGKECEPCEIDLICVEGAWCGASVPWIRLDVHVGWVVQDVTSTEMNRCAWYAPGGGHHLYGPYSMHVEDAWRRTTYL